MGKKPNLIYILADDMGYGDVSKLNSECGFKTPFLDLMCETGMTFTDAHSSSAVCTPSRYSVLTGRYNWRSRLKTGVLMGYSDHLIEEGTTTVADVFKRNGYKTACIGKWHLGMDFVKDKDFVQPKEFNIDDPVYDGVDYTKKIDFSPITNGFDYYYGISASLDMAPYVYIENDHFTAVPDHISEDHRKDLFKDNPEKNTQNGIGSKAKSWFRPGPTAPGFVHENVLDELSDKVLSKIDEYKDSPFYIYFPMPAPHGPIMPSKKFMGKSPNEYTDYVLQCDDVVGRILNKLKELNISDNTIVIFTADNGCSPIANYNELKKFGHNPSYHFRGHKADIFEGGHRIPYIIQWPDCIPENSVCDKTVCLTDLISTIADILGDKLADNEGVDSFSNLPLWRNPDAPGVREFTIHQSIDGSLAIRKGKYKLEMCPGSGGWSYPKPKVDDISALPKFQLYDIENDVSETTNIISEHEDVFLELKSLLLSAVKNGRTTKGPKQKNTGKEVWETIKWTLDN